MPSDLDASSSPRPLNAPLSNRYRRQTVIPEFGDEAQRRLASASVLCVGAGGLGSPVLAYLAVAGVGRIGIVDSDFVELSNLNRQILHRESSIGEPKTSSAVSTLKDLNSTVSLEAHQARLEDLDLSQLFGAYDVIVDATDNFGTRRWINRAALDSRKPLVWGSVLGMEGQVSVFGTDDGPCYECLYSEFPTHDQIPSPAEGGVLGAVCGVVGSMQAAEAIRLAAGLESSVAGKLLVYDAVGPTLQVLRIYRRVGCPACGTG